MNVPATTSSRCCRHALMLAGVMAFVAVVMTGCFASSNIYHSAETLEPGQVEFATAYHATNVSEICAEVEGQKECASTDDTAFESIWWPQAVPDLMVRFGIIDNLDLGLHGTLIGLKLDLKYRFLDTEYFSMAVDPSARVFFPFIVIREIAFDLPILATVKVGDWFRFYTGVHGLIGFWDIPFDADELGVTSFGIAVNAGFSFEFGNFFLRPEYTYNDYLADISTDAGAAGFSMVYHTIGLGFGFKFGAFGSSGGGDGEDVELSAYMDDWF